MNKTDSPKSVRAAVRAADEDEDTAKKEGFNCASPERTCSKQKLSNLPRRSSLKSNRTNEQNTYGYGHASPERTCPKQKRSNPPRRSSLKGSRTNDQDKYGYGHASPERTCLTYGRSKPRRSSLKGSRTNEQITSRRASLGCGATTKVEVNIRGLDFPVIRRRSIDFDTSVRVKEVRPVCELAASFRRDLWLTHDDFESMKKDRNELIRKWKNGEKIDDEDMRGLEKQLDSGSVMEKRLSAWDIVLNEQDDQEMIGQYDPDRIAGLYRSMTRTSPKKALELARQDREAVEKYLYSPKTAKLTVSCYMMRRASC